MQRECFLSRSNPNCPKCGLSEIGFSPEMVGRAVANFDYYWCVTCGTDFAIPRAVSSVTTDDPEIPQIIITSGDALPALREIANIYRAAVIDLETFNLSNKLRAGQSDWFDIYAARLPLQEKVDAAAAALAGAAAAWLELVEIDHV